MSARNRYRAIVFHPGPRSLWRTGRNLTAPQPPAVPFLRGEKEPDPAEIIIEHDFGFLAIARAWCRVNQRRLKNVRAEIHDTTLDA